MEKANDERHIHIVNAIWAEWAKSCSFAALFLLFRFAFESALKLANNCKMNKNELKGHKTY